MKSFYWRGDNFRGLAELAEQLASRPELTDYTTYLTLRERGLRSSALASLRRFIGVARDWPFEQRRDWVEWLISVNYARPEIIDLLPSPLRIELVSPTLSEWVVREPKNPLAYRWRGHSAAFEGAMNDFRRAIDLDPREQISRRLLVLRLNHEVFVATHELPNGYLGDPVADLKMLVEASEVVEGLSGTEERAALRERTRIQRELVDAYLDYHASDTGDTFAKWASDRGKPFHIEWADRP
jgi:hypothetical protein